MPGKVLLADDSLSVQKTVTQLLKEAGIEVVTVGNGEHAVRRLADTQPDLVLADVFMPVRSGFEVCDYIKNSEQFSRVPVLLLTSSMEPFDEKEAQRVRADGRLIKQPGPKPFGDPAAVVATVKQWLGRSAQAKPAAPVPPIEEFAATVPAAEAEPEPAYEEFATRPAPLTFGEQAAPLGFTDLVEPAPAAPVEAPAPAAMVPEAEPEPEPAPPPPITFPAEPPPPPAAEAPAKAEYKIEKPELASPWEMTGPPPGAPEISAGPGWDSQWKGVSEAEAMPPVLPPPSAEEAPPAAGRFEPSEFVAAMAAAAPSPPSGIDPALVETVVREVLERLSPQVMEQITREIVRPLAEALLKQKLDQP